MTSPDELVVDARGLRCPLPTLRLQRALREAAPGQSIRLIADDPMARIDVPHFLQGKGCELIEQADQDGVLSFLIAPPPPPLSPSPPL